MLFSSSDLLTQVMVSNSVTFLQWNSNGEEGGAVLFLLIGLSG
jgi:hypothetical protein